MAIKTGNSETDIFCDILDLLFVISYNTNLEKFQIFTMRLKRVNIPFHHVEHSISLLSGLDLSFLEVSFNDFFRVLRGVFEIQRDYGLIFSCHFYVVIVILVMMFLK